MADDEYTFTDRTHEQRRLASQAVGFDPLTERVFGAAGIGVGMRVLDLGFGAGDVAMLAAFSPCSSAWASPPPRTWTPTRWPIASGTRSPRPGAS